MGFGHSYETIEVDSYRDLPTPKRPGKPNVRYRIRNRDGSPHRDRFTDKDGIPTKDVDWSGSGEKGHGLGYPHDHHWVNGERGGPVPHT